MVTTEHKPVGYMVWNPDAGMPTVSHYTFKLALAEAERLRRENPGQRFYVMRPVTDEADAGGALAFDAGRTEGLAERRHDVVQAELAYERAWLERQEALGDLSVFEKIKARIEDFQSVVADCQCWFDGYTAAFSGRDDWQRPWMPSTDRLRDLNEALRAISRQASSRKATDDLDDEIPF